MELEANINMLPIMTDSPLAELAYQELSDELRSGLPVRLPFAATPFRGEVALERTDAGDRIRIRCTNDPKFVDEFAARIVDLIVVCHLAKPGSVRVGSVELHAEGESLEAPYLIQADHVWSAMEAADRSDLHFLKTIAIEQALNWHFNLPNAGDRISDGQCWNALNCLRYAITQFPQGESLVYQRIIWVVIGLEALYGDKQRSGKSAADFIGERLKRFITPLESVNERVFDEAMKDIYKTRNKFFHGRLSFPRADYSDYESDTFDEFFEVTNHVTNLGLALLIASFQELVARNWQSLGFDEHLLVIPREGKAAP